MTTEEQTTAKEGWERDWNKRRKWNSKVPTARGRVLLDERRTGLSVCLALNGGCILSWQPQSHPSHVTELQSPHTLSWNASSSHHCKDTIPIRFCFCFCPTEIFFLRLLWHNHSDCPDPGHVDVNVTMTYGGCQSIQVKAQMLCVQQW